MSQYAKSEWYVEISRPQVTRMLGQSEIQMDNKTLYYNLSRETARTFIQNLKNEMGEYMHAHALPIHCEHPDGTFTYYVDVIIR